MAPLNWFWKPSMCIVQGQLTVWQGNWWYRKRKQALWLKFEVELVTIGQFYKTLWQNGCACKPKVFEKYFCNFLQPLLLIGTCTNLTTNGFSIFSANGQQSFIRAVAKWYLREKLRKLWSMYTRCRMILKAVSFSILSCYCQIFYQMNPSMTRFSIWLYSKNFSILKDCQHRSCCKHPACRTAPHFSKATQL